MTGFREALLTKVLCIAEPRRFLPIVKYTGRPGRRRSRRRCSGCGCPTLRPPASPSAGLIIWSNDLLMALVGDLGHNTQASRFLWWAKDQA